MPEAHFAPRPFIRQLRAAVLVAREPLERRNVERADELNACSARQRREQCSSEDHPAVARA
eukprot:7085805-Prymnesium_polylepis.2